MQKKRVKKERKPDKQQDREKGGKKGEREGKERGREGGKKKGKEKCLIMKQIAWSHLSLFLPSKFIKHPGSYSTDHDKMTSESLKEEDRLAGTSKLEERQHDVFLGFSFHLP